MKIRNIISLFIMVIMILFSGCDTGSFKENQNFEIPKTQINHIEKNFSVPVFNSTKEKEYKLSLSSNSDVELLNVEGKIDEEYYTLGEYKFNFNIKGCKELVEKVYIDEDTSTILAIKESCNVYSDLKLFQIIDSFAHKLIENNLNQLIRNDLNSGVYDELKNDYYSYNQERYKILKEMYNYLNFSYLNTENFNTNINEIFEEQLTPSFVYYNLDEFYLKDTNGDILNNSKNLFMDNSFNVLRKKKLDYLYKCVDIGFNKSKNYYTTISSPFNADKEFESVKKGCYNKIRVQDNSTELNKIIIQMKLSNEKSKVLADFYIECKEIYYNAIKNRKIKENNYYNEYSDESLKNNIAPTLCTSVLEKNNLKKDFTSKELNDLILELEKIYE